MEKYKYVFFDMDGTFIDSRQFHIEAFYRFFNKYYHAVDMETVRNGIGDTIKAIFNHLHILDEEYDELFNKLGDFYSNETDDLIKKIPVLKGAKEVFENLNKKGLKLVVITNSLQQLTEKIHRIHGTNEYFTLLIGADKNSLDKQQRFVKVINQLGANLKEIVYVGDAKRDVQIANEIGIDSCLVYTSISWCDDLDYVRQHLKPKYIVYALNDLLKIV
jgi:Predicted phosphatases